MEEKRYLTAKEAADELEIAPATLYAYVSRGLIRSESGGGARRERKYRAEDVRRLKQRRELRRDPAAATAGALHWGTPLLESSITLIEEGRLYYRGYDATKLAAERSIEEVAGLIWTGDLAAPPLLADGPVRLPGRWGTLRRGLGDLHPLELFQVLLPVAGGEDTAAYDLRAEGVRATGARILRSLAAVAAGASRIEGGMAGTLAAGWNLGRPLHTRMIDMAMILAADHELNVSSFTVRCVASAGSTPYAAVAAGLGALGGIHHGRYTERVEALFDEIGRPERAREKIAGRLRRGETIPGFGHDLYPGGDPRGAALAGAVEAAFPRLASTRLALAIAQAMAETTGGRPTIDFGLVAMTRALGLPDGTALTLFALGRTAGWIGQAMEQYEGNRMIRPRARYVGVQPEERGA